MDPLRLGPVELRIVIDNREFRKPMVFNDYSLTAVIATKLERVRGLIIEELECWGVVLAEYIETQLRSW